MLNDGTHVVDARDLEPVVAKDSATALHAERAAELASNAGWWIGAGGLTALGGAVGLAVWTAETTTVKDAFDPQRLEWFAGAFGVVGAGTVLGIIGETQRGESVEESEAAFRAYDRDLRAHLVIAPRRVKVAAE